jgi:hypothetical protein
VPSTVTPVHTSRVTATADAPGVRAGALTRATAGAGVRSRGTRAATGSCRRTAGAAIAAETSEASPSAAGAQAGSDRAGPKPSSRPSHHAAVAAGSSQAVIP